MDKLKTDRREFWEQKILEWEANRYEGTDPKPSLLERLASKASASLRFRIAVAPELLAPHVRGKRILDIGCGSGLIAAPLIRHGAAAYIGVDIAPTAIANAKERASRSGISSHTTFHVAAVEDLASCEADIVVSLGLLDWLSDEELEYVFQASRNGQFFHAIAERRAALSQFVHRTYCWLSYGRKNGGYVPRYYRVGEMEALATRHHAGPFHVWRDRHLSFGAFFTSFDLTQQSMD
jgi:2-polyprenyl-3-methyl-5-hydroxy-6-metoxy-1,4-benzoquinol methylase